VKLRGSTLFCVILTLNVAKGKNLGPVSRSTHATLRLRSGQAHSTLLRQAQDRAQGKLVEGIARPEICVAGILLNFGLLTGVSGSASAERRFQPQKGYNPSPGSFTHFFYFARLPNVWPGYRAFSQFRRKTTVLSLRLRSGQAPRRLLTARQRRAWKLVRGCPDSPAPPSLATEPAPQYWFWGQ